MADMKEKNRRTFGILVVLAALLVCVTATLQYTLRKPAMEKNAKEGYANQLTGEGLSSSLQEAADESAFRVILGTHPTFDGSTGRGQVSIQNDNSNRAKMQVEYVLDATGETVYQSAVLSPGDEELWGELMIALPSGTYSATAYVHALDDSGKNIIGTMESEVFLTVSAPAGTAPEPAAGGEGGDET